MNKKIRVLCFASAVVAAACASQAAEVIYSNNFEAPSYTTGDLDGQDSWVANMYKSVSAQVVNGTGINTSQVLGKSTSATSAGGVSQAVSLGLGSYTSGSFSVDFYRSGLAPATVYAGFGNPADRNLGIAAQLNGQTFWYRDGVTTGTALVLYDRAANTFKVADNSWYRLTFNLDFVNNEITSVFAQNLTTGSAAVQLYFDSNATVANHAYVADETLWGHAYVRTGLSKDNTTFIDNITLTRTPANLGNVVGAACKMGHPVNNPI
jgi:hypothetical protein